MRVWLIGEGGSSMREGAARETALQDRGPCGLSCGKCVAFENGEIRHHAVALQELLGRSFGDYAGRFAQVQPAFGHYEAFAALLDHLASGTCGGCRKGSCLFHACRVSSCVREHGVDFCFQCRSYPCDETGFPERLERIWRENNDAMAQEGVKFFEERMRNCHRYP